MVVEVIKTEPDPSVVKQVVCGNCGVTLQYVPNDVLRRDGLDYSGGSDGEEWVECPNCEKKAVIDSW
jgi:hypothetical protein